MDRRVDLTRDRDFRHRRVDPSVPRSIFKNDDSVVNTQPFYYNNSTQLTTIATQTGTMMSYDLVSQNTTAFMNYPVQYINSTQLSNEDTCYRCGKDISRIPWDKEIYFGLCKKCDSEIERKVKRTIW